MVAGLEVAGLCLDVGAFCLSDVALDVPAGQCCVLLGPTGAGKSLLAESICGLRRASAGSVHIAGRDVTALDPAMRRIGYLPQDYALLPFQSVRENLAFALAARRVPPARRRCLVDEMLQLLRMQPLADRRPSRLSGGERQRAALGRALIASPDLLVLDEPLSALDDTTAQQLRGEMLQLRRRSSLTALHICHSLEEALCMGDRLAIIRNGRIVQTGACAELYSRPLNYFVARLLCVPAMLDGEIRQANGRRGFFIADRHVSDTDLPAGPAWGVVDPGRLSVSAEASDGGEHTAIVEVVVADNPLAPLRPQLRLAGPVSLSLPHTPASRAWTAGQRVFLTVPRDGVHVVVDEPC